MRKLLFALTLLLLLLVKTPQVQAQAASGAAIAKPVAKTTITPMNLTISPVTLSLETDPGVSVKSQLKIRNNSTQTEVLKISIGTFAADETGQKPKLLDPKEGDEFLNWIHFAEPQITVAPGEWVDVPFSFDPPASAALSYYYTIILTRVNEAQTTQNETKIEGAPGVLLLTTVRSPNTKRELTVDSFTAKFPIVEFLPQEFELKIKNSGNIHVIPQGNIFIDGQGKKDLAILSINKPGSNVLPDSTRTFSINWKDGFPVGINPDAEKSAEEQASGLQALGLEWNFAHANWFRFGKYTAHLLMVYDNGDRDVPIESSVSFWIIPWKLLLLLLAIFLLAFWGFSSIILAIIRAVTGKSRR